MDVKLAFTASEAAAAQQALATLVDRYGNGKEAQADVIIALGRALSVSAIDSLPLHFGKGQAR